jgi:hypothetical protein
MNIREQRKQNRLSKIQRLMLNGEVINKERIISSLIVMDGMSRKVAEEEVNAMMMYLGMSDGDKANKETEQEIKPADEIDEILSAEIISP